MAQETEALIDQQIQEVDGDVVTQTDDAPLPIYKVSAYDTKVPVAASTGKLWKSRIEQAKSKLKRNGTYDRWDLARDYFDMDHSVGPNGQNRKRSSDNRISDDGYVESENIVYSNVTAIVPAVYMKNPDVECTSATKDEQGEMRAKQLDRLLTTLVGKRNAPGLNLKPKAKRAVLNCAITNIAWGRVGYTRKDDSSETALVELGTLAKRLEDAKDPKEIIEIEGEISALENKIDMLHPSGPNIKLLSGKEVLMDSDATMIDGSDARWMANYEYISNEFLIAQYAQKDPDNETVNKSIYKPTHILKINVSEDNADTNDYDELQGQTEHVKFGYGDSDTFKAAQRTKIWYVWDKVTQRVFMYNDGDWSWPIWVWDDPYNLDTFFPYFPLSFYDDPDDVYGKSEILYYLDQQDAINVMNNEMAKIRQSAKNNILYDKMSIDDEATILNYLKGNANGYNIAGVNVPEGKKLSDVIFSAIPPSGEFIKFFDKTPMMQAIDRLSSVTPTMKANEYKTNTTNKAIESYESTTQTRLDEKIDAVEDWIGNMLWAVGQMCLQFMPQQQVVELIGPELGTGWANQTPVEIRRNYSIRCIGGSSLKPTSKVKKEQAMQIGQTLAPFAKSSPAVVKVLLNLFQRAYKDDAILNDADIKMIMDGIAQGEQQQQQQSGTQQMKDKAEADAVTLKARAYAEQVKGENQGKEDKLALDNKEIELNHQTENKDHVNDTIEQVSMLIDQMPPEVKRVLGNAIGQGQPFGETVAAIIQQLSNPQNANTQQAPMPPQ